MKKVKIKKEWGSLKKGVHEVSEHVYNYYISIGIGEPSCCDDIDDKENCPECEEQAKKAKSIPTQTKAPKKRTTKK